MGDNLQQKTFSGAIWGFLSKFSIQGFGFIQGIILARLLMPSDYGLVAMVGIFTAISYTLVDSGFANALVRKQDRTAIDFSTVFDANVGISTVLCIILCACSGLIANFYHQPLLKDIVCLNALQLLLGSFITIQGVKMSIDLQFKQINIISIYSTILSGILSIILAFAGFGVMSIVYPGFFAILIRVLLYWHYQHWTPGIKFSLESFKTMFAYGSKLLASSLLDRVFINIYPIIIGKKFSAADLGQYTRANNYACIPSQTMIGIIGSVAFPVLSKLQDDDDRLRDVYRRMLRISAFVLFPIMIGMAALARPLVIVLITEKWAQCIVYLQILCFSQMWYPVHSLNLNLLQVKGRSDLFLRLEIVKKILYLVAIFASVPFGILAMCIAEVIMCFFCLIINTHYTKTFINIGFFDQMKDMFPSFVYSIFMGFAILGVTFFLDSDVAKLVVGIPVGGISYFIMASLTKSNDLAYVKILVRNNILSRFHG